MHHSREELDVIVRGILEYSLKPYSVMHNIDIIDLIKALSNFYNGLKNNNNTDDVFDLTSTLELLPIEENEEAPTVPIKRGRGRPKGSKSKKNKMSNGTPTEMSVSNGTIIKRGRGRPPGIKKQNALKIMSDEENNTIKEN